MCEIGATLKGGLIVSSVRGNIYIVFLVLMLRAGYSLADNPYYGNGLLVLPVVDELGGVGTYQDVRFSYSEEGGWRLDSYEILGSQGLKAAPVSDVEVIVTNESPAQVLLRASGEFGNGCYIDLRPATYRRSGRHFDVVLSYEYNYVPGTACLAAAVHYKKTVPLPVYGLPAGDYTYDINGLTGTFELSSDNEMSGDCDLSVVCPD